MRSAVRKRGQGSEKYNNQIVKTKRDKRMEFKKINWLSDKYISSFGLRKWSWAVIIDGIIKENI